MKLYLFTKNDYGQSYFVLAKSKEDALEFLKKSDEYGADAFINSTVDKLPRKFFIQELSEGQVYRYETS